MTQIKPIYLLIIQALDGAYILINKIYYPLGLSILMIVVLFLGLSQMKKTINSI